MIGIARRIGVHDKVAIGVFERVERMLSGSAGGVDERDGAGEGRVLPEARLVRGEGLGLATVGGLGAGQTIVTVTPN